MSGHPSPLPLQAKPVHLCSAIPHMVYAPALTTARAFSGCLLAYFLCGFTVLSFEGGDTLERMGRNEDPLLLPRRQHSIHCRVVSWVWTEDSCLCYELIGSKIFISWSPQNKISLWRHKKYTFSKAEGVQSLHMTFKNAFSRASVSHDCSIT